MVENVTKGADGRWYKKCPSCGSSQSYLRKHYAEHSFGLGKECKSCSNKRPENNAHKGWVKDVLRISFVRKYKVNAELRNIEWNVDYEYLADLLISQDNKCALTGWEISAMNVNSNTASLDRVDSSIGYVEGNLHWVHKMVNMCKQSYALNDFIDMCKLIAKK
jgi:hypothetical protein